VLTAIGLIFMALILGYITMWIDYRSGADPTGPKDFLEVMAVMALVFSSATALEKTHGFNWWLTASAVAAIVIPLWWLYLNARKRRLATGVSARRN
jgi:hypothetical protein